MKPAGMHNRLLILGGARSGKTRMALARADRSGLEKVYVATAAAWDDEMRARIARHKAERDAHWTTLEEQQALEQVLADHAAPGRILLVDCLTLWLTNILLADEDCTARIETLAATVALARGPLILVSNEVGLGIVPDNALARRFRDLQGQLNQRIATECDEVIFVAAGLPLTLKTRSA
jgi:adenosylcobinamide kinase / adenosylcobinamide-phosphate guanylyltransferase